jgi:hypothetical protein
MMEIITKSPFTRICHSERSEESCFLELLEILRYAQDDKKSRFSTTCQGLCASLKAQSLPPFAKGGEGGI